jgi:hypothetical protein
LRLVKLVGGVHLLEIKLEFILVGNGDTKTLDADLLVIEVFAKGSNV